MVLHRCDHRSLYAEKLGNGVILWYTGHKGNALCALCPRRPWGCDEERKGRRR